MTMPFAPGQTTGQPAAPQIVRGADGQLYAQTPQGLVPVQISAQPSPGSPSQPPIQQAPQPQAQPMPQAPITPNQQIGQQPVFNATPDTIVRGSGFPAWMQGRTVAQVTQMVEAMKDGYIRDQQRSGQQIPAGQVAPNGQPQAQPQPNGQPAVPSTMDARAFYQDPVKNTRDIVAQAIRDELTPMLRPVLQQSVQTQVQQMQEQFLQSYPDARPFMAAMQPHLSALSPEQLARPETWNTVYRYVLGEAVLARQGADTAARGYNPLPQAPQPFGAPARVTPQGMFFSEGSTPSPASFGQQPSVTAANLSIEELATARAVGMTPEAYASAKADIIANRMPVMPQPNGGQNVRGW